ncbi:unnamed protein product [Sphacelaria rigidula]
MDGFHVTAVNTVASKTSPVEWFDILSASPRVPLSSSGSVSFQYTYGLSSVAIISCQSAEVFFIEGCSALANVVDDVFDIHRVDGTFVPCCSNREFFPSA